MKFDDVLDELEVIVTVIAITLEKESVRLDDFVLYLVGRSLSNLCNVRVKKVIEKK